MPDRPFHHGNLRAVLLDQAEIVLRDRGTDALSLRELAREAGVSHGAPRSHFIDRNALLDALAERGFTHLADDLRAAVAGEPDDYVRALRAAAAAYVGFAVRESALMDLMFAAKAEAPSEAVLAAAEDLFTTLTDVMSVGVKAGLYTPADVPRLTLLLGATLQGISAFVTSRRITPAHGEELTDDAVTLFVAGVGATASDAGAARPSDRQAGSEP